MIGIADCNSFYCSCERLFRPDLLGKPVVVLSNNDGCIVSRTDEAKKLGIDMAVPYFQCKDILLQNNVTVFSSNYYLYGDMSKRVMDIFKEKIGFDNVEIYSVDEAFLNLDNVPAEQLYQTAVNLKFYTEQCTGIPICVGISHNKLLSKIANKLSKKNKLFTRGVLVLKDEDDIREALLNFDVGDIWGVGGRYAYKLKQMGIDTAWKLRNMPVEWAKKNLGGVVGERIVRQLRGETISGFNEPLTEKKMIATTRMFGKAVYDLKDIEQAVVAYTSRACEKLRRQDGAAGEISVFLMYQDLTSREYATMNTSHYHTLDSPTSNTLTLSKVALEVLRKIYFSGRKYKKCGVILSKIVKDTSIQGNLFNPAITLNRALMQAIDNINFSTKEDTVVVASAGVNKHWKMRQELRSKKFTTNWNEIPNVK